jgi:hypothetical protein
MPVQEERNLLGFFFMLHQQTHVLLIHRLKATKKAKPSCYMMDEVCHFV